MVFRRYCLAFVCFTCLLDCCFEIESHMVQAGLALQLTIHSWEQIIHTKEHNRGKARKNKILFFSTQLLDQNSCLLNSQPWKVVNNLCSPLPKEELAKAGDKKSKQANKDVLEIRRLLLSPGDFFLSMLLGWGRTVTNIPYYYSINTHLCPDKLITATDNQISNFLIQRNSSHLLNNTITQNINILFWEFKNIK